MKTINGKRAPTGVLLKTLAIAIATAQIKQLPI